VYVVAVFAISVTAEAKLPTVEDCHLVTFPVFPPSVSVVLLVPVQIEAPPVIVPPTETGLTIIADTVLKAGEQSPLVISAR
jgi:hypothetical protein